MSTGNLKSLWQQTHPQQIISTCNPNSWSLHTLNNRSQQAISTVDHRRTICTENLSSWSQEITSTDRLNGWSQHLNSLYQPANPPTQPTQPASQPSQPRQPTSHPASPASPPNPALHPGTSHPAARQGGEVFLVLWVDYRRKTTARFIALGTETRTSRTHVWLA